MSLTEKQIEMLLTELSPARIQRANGQAHIAAWDVRRWLLRIFGWGGWDFTVVQCDQVAEIHHPVTAEQKKARYTVVYRVIGRLTIRDPHGDLVAVFEDGATGDAANQPSLGDAHDMALKTAMSQSLKRCAANLGDQFGLSLYNGGRPDAVVIRSIPHLAETSHEEPEVHPEEAVA